MQLHNGALYSPIPFTCTCTCSTGEKDPVLGEWCQTSIQDFASLKTHGPICTRQIFLFFADFVVKNGILQVWTQFLIPTRFC